MLYKYIYVKFIRRSSSVHRSPTKPAMRPVSSSIVVIGEPCQNWYEKEETITKNLSYFLT